MGIWEYMEYQWNMGISFGIWELIELMIGNIIGNAEGTRWEIIGISLGRPTFGTAIFICFAKGKLWKISLGRWEYGNNQWKL